MNMLDQKFRSIFGYSDDLKRFFCPGRVNLIGEHIDYLGGSVMPTAISLGITAICRSNDSNVLRIHSTDFEGITEFDLNDLPDSKTGHWSDFVLGVILNLKSRSSDIKGCDILFDSDLPRASGLSSSAALEVLNYYLFHFLSTELEPDRIEMALNCQQIENHFIGVNCGIMDQFAVANGRKNHAMLLNCGTLEHEFVPLYLGDQALLIINTNRPRTLAESAYNQRRHECDEALRIIAKQHPINHLVEATMDDLLLISDPILRKRTRHAITEQQRVILSAEALRANDLAALGKLMSQSHVSLRDDFEVSCSELDLVVDFLSQKDACAGARMTGAGFGGCCIALVDAAEVEQNSAELEHVYNAHFGFSPTFQTCLPSDGVRFLHRE